MVVALLPGERGKATGRDPAPAHPAPSPRPGSGSAVLCRRGLMQGSRAGRNAFPPGGPHLQRSFNPTPEIRRRRLPARSSPSLAV